MKIIGCDLHARQQTIAMLDSDSGELEEKTLEHQGETVREFYSALSGPILVGIEATGSMQWFLEMLEATFGRIVGSSEVIVRGDLPGDRTFRVCHTLKKRSLP